MENTCEIKLTGEAAKAFENLLASVDSMTAANYSSGFSGISEYIRKINEIFPEFISIINEYNRKLYEDTLIAIKSMEKFDAADKEQSQRFSGE